MNFRNSKFALLLGAINGVIFYLAYQPIKVAYVKYLWYIKNDDYVYVVLSGQVLTSQKRPFLALTIQ